MPPGIPPVSSDPGLSEMAATGFGPDAATITIDPTEIVVSGDWAFRPKRGARYRDSQDRRRPDPGQCQATRCLSQCRRVANGRSRASMSNANRVRPVGRVALPNKRLLLSRVACRAAGHSPISSRPLLAGRAVQQNRETLGRKETCEELEWWDSPRFSWPR